MKKELSDGVNRIASEELATSYGSVLSQSDLGFLTAKVCSSLQESLDNTTTMDGSDGSRFTKVASDTSAVLVDFFTGTAFIEPGRVGPALQAIPSFRSQVATRATELQDQLRRAYLSGGRGKAPARKYLNKTRPMYEFVRLTLGIRMHGSENLDRFANGHGFDEQTIGQNISLIHEVCLFIHDFSNIIDSDPLPPSLFGMEKFNPSWFQCSHNVFGLKTK
jgi:phenylalanine ammonia-lyase